MSTPVKIYEQFQAALGNKEINLLTDTIKVMLLTSGYTPNQNTDNYKDDVVANEIAATGGYTAGGFTLTSKTFANALLVQTFDADDVVYAASTITARYAVIYDASPATDATRPLIGYLDFGSDQSSAASDFKIIWGVNGIFTMTVS